MGWFFNAVHCTIFSLARFKYPSSSFFVSCLPFTALPFLSLFFCWLFMIVRILGFIGYLTHLFSPFPLLWPTIIVKILKFMFFFFLSGWYDGLTEVFMKQLSWEVKERAKRKEILVDTYLCCSFFFFFY